jgi:hypothetical protein
MALKKVSACPRGAILHMSEIRRTYLLILAVRDLTYRPSSSLRISGCGRPACIILVCV